MMQYQATEGEDRGMANQYWTWQEAIPEDVSGIATRGHNRVHQYAMNLLSRAQAEYRVTRERWESAGRFGHPPQWLGKMPVYMT
jgi:hypothetical protein